jgi:hypothetical protein
MLVTKYVKLHEKHIFANHATRLSKKTLNQLLVSPPLVTESLTNRSWHSGARSPTTHQHIGSLQILAMGL